MDDGVGATLCRARTRRKLSYSEVEEATKIRARFLRAIEEEEWDALPEGSYARSFIRTYATYLGLDAERLAAEYAPLPTDLGSDRPTRAAAPRGSGDRRSRRGRGPRPGLVSALVILAVLAVAIGVGISTGGGGGGPGAQGGGSGTATRARSPRSSAAAELRARPRGVVLRLVTKAEVWVCVLDHQGRRLVDGAVLSDGTEAGPFHSGSFTVAFGNGEVAMQVNGKEIGVPASSSPIGYAIHRGGRLEPLVESERPTCL